MEIGDRINLVVKYKAKSAKEFAEQFGWSAAYISKLVSNAQGVGMKPIREIIEKYPDIDARWLITGEGYIFGTAEDTTEKAVSLLLNLERYVCVMNDEERLLYIDCITNLYNRFPKSTIDRWEMLYQQRYGEYKKLIKKSMLESVIIP